MLVVIDNKQSQEDSFYISAPISIDGANNVLTVLVHRDVNTQRMYLHSVILTEKLLESRVSDTLEKTSRTHSGSRTSADIHNILHQAITYKPLSSDKATEDKSAENNEKPNLESSLQI